MQRKGSKHRGIERLAKANARYLEQALKPKPQPAAYADSYNADTGEYTINQGGRQLLKRAITNGAIAQGQRVDVRGRLIDSTPRPLQRVTTAPVSNVEKLNGYILFSSINWLRFLYAASPAETYTNDLTGQPLGFGGQTGISTSEDFDFEEYALATPANVQLVEAIFNKFLVTNYDYAAYPIFPAIDEGFLRPLAQARGIGRFPLYNVDGASPSDQTNYQIPLDIIDKFFVRAFPVGIYQFDNRQIGLDRVASNFGLFSVVANEFEDFAEMNIFTTAHSVEEWATLSSEQQSRWYFPDTRSDLAAGIEGEILLGSDGELLTSDRSYLDVDALERTYEVVAQTALGKPTIIWIRD